MVIMAIDHVRDFFHDDAYAHNPLDLQTTTPQLYFTRWITHFCAPTFLFLAGTSAYLMGLKKTKAELSSFLIKRGFWLILVEVGIVTLSVTFSLVYPVLILQVIWATGISMIILGLLVRFPYGVILIIACCVIFGHNLLDYPEAAHHYQVGFWWDLIHNGRFTYYSYANNHGIVIVYAFLPWTGIMLLGYCFGKIYEPAVNSVQRRKTLFVIGAAFILLFVLLRLINAYGDPFPWTAQRNKLYTFLSYMNVNKYPPTLMYTCITLGPALIFLALTEKVRNNFSSILIIYGRVPFFYYVIHFYLIHTLNILLLIFVGWPSNDILITHFPFRPQFGLHLWGVYLVWLVVIAIMYPLCKWYNEYKNTHRQWWLSYV